MRVKIIGTRTEVGEMWAIGSIKEDYLGCVAETLPSGSCAANHIMPAGVSKTDGALSD